MTAFRLIVTVILTGVGSLAPAASLTDFGYQAIRVNDQLLAGTRPLLIIRADIAGDDNTAHQMSYYDNLVFNFFNVPSANGFMLVNSSSRFFFTRAGSGTIDLINNVDFTATERAQLGNDTQKAGHCINAAARGGFDFAAQDANADGVITSDELVVLVVENGSTADSGAARWANPAGTGAEFVIEGRSTKFRGQICLVTQNVSFATLCHELSHVLGAVDVYGIWNQEALSANLTVMSATITTADNPDTFHFDPWHKLQFGWCEPRLRDMDVGGVENLPDSGLVNITDKPVLLYDSARGTSEYFMLEYRSDKAGSYDDDINDSGLVIWHVQQDAAHQLVQVASPYINGGMHQTMWAETPPNLMRGGGQWGPAAGAGAWDSGAVTPLLKWNDGTDSLTTIHVRPFSAGTDNITVEIRTARETWLEFNHVGTETGAFNTPFNTLSEGITNTSYGGRLRIKAGQTSAGVTSLDKRMTIEAYGGPMHLGGSL